MEKLTQMTGEELIKKIYLERERHLPHVALKEGTHLSSLDGYAEMQNYLKGQEDFQTNPIRMPNLKFANCTALGIYMPNADLRYADFSKARLLGSNLRGAYLRNANLERANLATADLGEANLIGADLRNADLNGVDFIDADLRWANLREAGLVNILVSAGTVFRGTKVTKEQREYIESILFDGNDRFIVGENAKSDQGVEYQK